MPHKTTKEVTVVLFTREEIEEMVNQAIGYAVEHRTSTTGEPDVYINRRDFLHALRQTLDGWEASAQ